MRTTHPVIVCSLIALVLTPFTFAQTAKVNYVEGSSGSLPFHGQPGDEDKVDWSIDYQNLRAHIISVDKENPREFQIEGKGSRFVFNPLKGHVVLLGGTNSRLTLAPEVNSIVLYGYSIRRNPGSRTDVKADSSYVTWSRERGIFAVGDCYIVEKVTERSATGNQPTSGQPNETETIRMAAGQKAKEIGCRAVYTMCLVAPEEKCWRFEYGEGKRLLISEKATIDIVLTLHGGIVRDGDMLINLSDEPLTVGGVTLRKAEYALRKGDSRTLKKGEGTVFSEPMKARAFPDSATTDIGVPKIEKPSPAAGLPGFAVHLNGPREVRVRNPNAFIVYAGVRKDNAGVNLEVPANGTRSVYVPDGKYEVYFVYSNKPDALFKGDDFTLDGHGVEIQIVKVVGGNYGIRQVK